MGCDLVPQEESQYTERCARGAKTCVLPHIYWWVEPYAVSSRDKIITAGLSFSLSALNKETAGYFKMIEKQVHHINVTTTNITT
jgi:hypothetical protein